jgi:heme/copper-type cytochrome/quinol oxidase subunit 4
LALLFLVVAIVGIYKGFPGWIPPDDCASRRQIFLFYASIVLTSLAVFLVVPLPFFRQRIYGFEFMFYYLGIGVSVLWFLYFVFNRKSEYWRKVSIAATTLLPV